ncbi:hypothetical protein I4U23_011088 [Adineta vaga]|nr:hypothetical protein I4U23_011088 [Adineta vaga]
MLNNQYSDSLSNNLIMLSEDDPRIQYLGSNPLSNFPILSFIFVSFIVNSLLFYFLSSSLTPLIKTYIISTIHSIATVSAMISKTNYPKRTKPFYVLHVHMLAEELSTIPLNLNRLTYGTVITSYTFRAVPQFIRISSKLSDTTSIVFVIAQVLLFILIRILNLYWTILIVRKPCTV